MTGARGGRRAARAGGGRRRPRAAAARGLGGGLAARSPVGALGGGLGAAAGGGAAAAAGCGLGALAGLLGGLASAPRAGPSRMRPSRSALRRTRSACASSMLEEWVLTPMPSVAQRSSVSLLVSPSSLASSWTRILPANVSSPALPGLCCGRGPRKGPGAHGHTVSRRRCRPHEVCSSACSAPIWSRRPPADHETVNRRPERTAESLPLDRQVKARR